MFLFNSERNRNRDRKRSKKGTRSGTIIGKGLSRAGIGCILIGCLLLSACSGNGSLQNEDAQDRAAQNGATQSVTTQNGSEDEVSEVSERVFKIAETSVEENSEDEVEVTSVESGEDTAESEDAVTESDEQTVGADAVTEATGNGTIEFRGKLFSESTRLFSFDTLPLAEELETLNRFPNLAKVDLSSFEVTDEELADMQAALPGVEIVRTISLADLGSAFSKMATRTDVKELDFSNLKITNMDALRTCLDQMTSLEQLVLCETGLTNEQMAPLRDEYPTVKVVWMIHMGIHRFRTDVVAFSTMAEEDDKEFISSYNCEQFKYCTDLMALDLGHQKIHELDWLQYVPNLRVLILADTNIEDITRIGELKELRYLEVFGCYWITDWSPLENCTKMEDLNICFDHRTEDYNYLNFMPNLKRFWAKKAYNPETIEEIKLILPADCEFNYEGGEGSTDCGWRGVERFYAMRNCFLNNCLDPLFAD